jgi:MFS family permease
VISAVAGGIAPIAGGAIAQWFASTHLAVVVRWTSADNRNELLVASFAHWEFLFGISAVLGLYAIHAVARVGEAGEHTERLVIQELALEALRTVNHLSSVGGVLGALCLRTLVEIAAAAPLAQTPAQSAQAIATGSIDPSPQARTRRDRCTALNRAPARACTLHWRRPAARRSAA